MVKTLKSHATVHGEPDARSDVDLSVSEDVRDMLQRQGLTDTNDGVVRAYEQVQGQLLHPVVDRCAQSIWFDCPICCKPAKDKKAKISPKSSSAKSPGAMITCGVCDSGETVEGPNGRQIRRYLKDLIESGLEIGSPVLEHEVPTRRAPQGDIAKSKKPVKSQYKESKSLGTKTKTRTESSKTKEKQGKRKPKTKSFPLPPIIQILIDKHKAYEAGLSVLSLSDKHRAELHKRGLNDETIEKWGIKSYTADNRTEVGQAMHVAWDKAGDHIAGLAWNTDDAPMKWSLNLPYSSGIILPVRDQGRRIVELKIRPTYTDTEISRYKERHDGAEPPKTLNLTGGNAKAESRFHVPVTSKDRIDDKIADILEKKKTTATIHIVEGEYAAEILTQRSNWAVISAPGINQFKKAVDAAIWFGATRVVLCPDAEHVEHPTVARHTARAIKHCLDKEIDFQLMVWDLRDADGHQRKGIDDLPAEMWKREVKRLTDPEEIEEYVTGFVDKVNRKIRRDNAKRPGDERPTRSVDNPYDFVDDDDELGWLADGPTLSLDDLMERYPERQPVIMDGLLREEEIMTVVSSAKGGKSWLMGGLAMAIATGRRWLSHETEQKRVLYIDDELAEAELAYRMKKIQNGLGLYDADYLSNNLRFRPIAGRNLDVFSLERVLEAAEAEQFDVVIIDALYRLLPMGTSENDNAGMTQVFNQLIHYTRKYGVAIVVVHHASKGDQSGRSVIDVGAGAGAIGRAGNTHLVLRKHKDSDSDNPMAVLEKVARSFPPSDPLTLEFEFPLWRERTDVAPVIRTPAQAKQEKAQEDRDADADSKVLEALEGAGDGGLTERKIRTEASMGAERVKKALARLIEAGEVKKVPSTTKKKKSFTYHLSTVAAPVARRRSTRKDLTAV